MRLFEYLPREVSRPTKYLLDRVAVRTETLTSDRQRPSPLYQDGLEITCNVKITIADTGQGHALTKAYSELVHKLYSKVIVLNQKIM